MSSVTVLKDTGYMLEACLSGFTPEEITFIRDYINNEIICWVINKFSFNLNTSTCESEFIAHRIMGLVLVDSLTIPKACGPGCIIRGECICNLHFSLEKHNETDDPMDVYASDIECSGGIDILHADRTLLFTLGPSESVSVNMLATKGRGSSNAAFDVGKCMTKPGIRAVSMSMDGSFVPTIRPDIREKIRRALTDDVITVSGEGMEFLSKFSWEHVDQYDAAIKSAGVSRGDFFVEIDYSTVFVTIQSYGHYAAMTMLETAIGSLVSKLK
jgi:hypothetical protein